MSSISRPPTKIGDLLFHGKNDNNEAVSCLRAKSFFLNYLDIIWKELHTILLGENIF